MSESMTVSDLIVDIDTFEFLETQKLPSSRLACRAIDKRTGEQVRVLVHEVNFSSPTNRSLIMKQQEFFREKSPLIPELVGCGQYLDDAKTFFFMVFKYPLSELSLDAALMTEMCGCAPRDWDATSKTKYVFGFAAALCLLDSRDAVDFFEPAWLKLDDNVEPFVDPMKFSMNMAGDPSFEFLVTLSEAFQGCRYTKLRESVGAIDMSGFGMTIREFFKNYDSNSDASLHDVMLPKPPGEIASCMDSMWTMSGPEVRPPVESILRHWQNHPLSGVTRAASPSRMLPMELGQRDEGIPDFYLDLITRCCDEDVERRPSCQEVVQLLQDNTEKYMFPGADLAAVKEYESRILSSLPQLH